MTKKPKKWVACDLESQYYNDDRKVARSERKRTVAKDRSKYKKSDLDKVQKKEVTLDPSLKRGRVLSIISQGVNVCCDDTLYLCTLRGSLKKIMQKTKNLVAVGDWVYFDPSDGNFGVIEHVEERHSILSRQEQLHRRQEQIIAANIDQVLITLSLVSPPLKPFLADRYLIAAKKGNMTPIIVVNKIDLLDNDPHERELYRAFSEGWSPHVPIIEVSVATGTGIDKLKEVMTGKTSVFAGQSGVGKSSLINAVSAHKRAVSEIVERTRKGAHTTTRAELLPLDCGGFVVDTPGIQSFGIWNLEKEEIASYFSDIQELSQGCRFSDCSHRLEEMCAVKEAVNDDRLPALRYESYIYLLESVNEEHKPR